MRDFTLQSPLSIFYLLLLQLAVVLKSVPSEFWMQVLALLEVPELVIRLVSPFIGAICWTMVEVIATAYEQDKLRKEGKLQADYHDSTAKYWPLKIFVGSMTGLFCMAVFGQAIIAVIPKAPQWTIGFLGGVAGYWFLSKKFKNVLSDNETKKDDEA